MKDTVKTHEQSNRIDPTARHQNELMLLGLLLIWAFAVGWLILEAVSVFGLR